MLTKILKVKEWKFQCQVMKKLHEYFAITQLSERKRDLIMYHFARLLETGKFNGKMLETLQGVDHAIEQWKNERKNSNS